MEKHTYIRIKSETVPATLTGITNACNSPLLPEADKEDIKTLLRDLGYVVCSDCEGNTKIFPPKNVFDTWAIRAESKRLICKDDLKRIVFRYENGASLENVLNDGEVAQIIEFAANLPSYKCHRTHAVEEAYMAFCISRKNGLDYIPPVTEEPEEEEEDEDNSEEE